VAAEGADCYYLGVGFGHGESECAAVMGNCGYYVIVYDRKNWGDRGWQIGYLLSY